MSLLALSSSKVLAELRRLLLASDEDAPGQRHLLAVVVSAAKAQGADPPRSRPSWWPLGLASIPQSRQPNQGPGLPRSLRSLWDWRGFLFLSARLLLPHPVLEQEGPHRGNPQWQNGSIRLSRPAEGFRGNVWQMGSWVFGGGSSEEKEKEEEKYQREVVFCFHTHTRQCPPMHTTNN